MDVLLACVDHGPATERVIAQASDLARRLEAELVVLHVARAEPEWVGYGPGPDTVRDSVAEELRRAHRDTQELGARLRAEGLPAVKALTIQGPAPEIILEQAEALGASMIVLGARARGLRSLVAGSVSRSVLRRARRPVLVVPHEQA